MSEECRIDLRVTPEFHDRLLAAASERGFSMTWLAKRAITDYLDRLLPVEEIKFTRD